MCDRSFFQFVRIVGGSVNQGGVIDEHIHGQICRALENPLITKRLAIATPRDWLKSTVPTKWWTIYLYLRDQEERQLIAAENERLSSSMLRWIGKQLMTNELLRKLYRDKLSYHHPDDGSNEDGTPKFRLIDAYWRKTCGGWSGKQLNLPRKGAWNEPSIMAIGIRGAVQGGHYTSIHIDDLVGEKAMESVDVMDDCRRWFDNVNETLVNPDHESPTGSKIYIIGTHWGIGDFFHYVQTKYTEYSWYIAPCRKDVSLDDQDFDSEVVGSFNCRWVQHPDQANGETNWPGSPFTTKYYVDMLNNPEKVAIYWAQHANQPGKAGGFEKFDTQWLNYYRLEDRSNGQYIVCLKEDTSDGEAFRVQDMKLYGAIDPGGFAVKKRLTKGSRNAIVIAGQPYNSVKKFILHAEAFHFKKPSDFIDKIFAAHDKWSPRNWMIDTEGQQTYIYEDIIEARNVRGVRLSIAPLQKDRSKDSKDNDIVGLIEPVSQGEFYIHRTHTEAKAEIATFPGGMTRDILDMIAKLMKHRLSRKKKRDTAHLNITHQVRRTSGRNPVSGY